jgi:hypothetical protein
MVLIYLLIAFFISLLTYQLILAFYPTIEGMETNSNNKDNSNEALNYVDYPTDPLVCCKQNSGNIEYLKGRVDDMSTNSVDISKMQTDMAALQQQMDDLGTQMTQLSGNMISQEPVDTSSLEGSDQTPVVGDETTGDADQTQVDGDTTTGDGEEDEDQTTDMS